MKRSPEKLWQNDEQKKSVYLGENSEFNRKKAMLNLFGVTGSSRWPEVAILAMGQMADRNF